MENAPVRLGGNVKLAKANMAEDLEFKVLATYPSTVSFELFRLRN